METVTGLALLTGLAAYWVRGAGLPVGSRRELALLSTILGALLAVGAVLLLPPSNDLHVGCFVGLLAAFSAVVTVTVQRRKRKSRVRAPEGSR